MFNQGYVDRRVGECPCKDCKDREHEKYICHDVCEKYLSWKQRNTDVKAKDREEKFVEDILREYVIEKNYKLKMAAMKNTSARRRKKN